MNTKVFLVDLDGVVLNRTDFFSKRAETLYPSANHAEILKFFTGGLYKKITLGQVGLIEALSEVLPDWNVNVNVDEVLEAWFSGENNIDKEVVDRIQEIRKSGVKCVIATDHSKYRKDDVWNNLGMRDFFDDIIASADIGATKEESDFYKKSMGMLDIENPNQVSFTDDDPKNVAVAESLGINSFVFEDIKSFERVL